MINTIEEFVKDHPNAVIVNYDIAETNDEGYGLTYRKSRDHTEIFRTDRLGKYLKYPYIQQYTELTDKSYVELFIIHNRKMYELELLDADNHLFRIKREITNINPKLYMDDKFMDTRGNNRKPSRNHNDEPIWKIEE